VTRVRFIVAGVAALAVALVGAAAASASNVNATATVSAGTLSLSSSAAPTVSATLDGTDQAPSYTMPMTVNDATGSGNGWNVTITSTTFSTGGGSPHLLSTGASTVTGVTSACATGTCTNPTNGISYNLAVPAGGTAPTAVKLFNAAANSGLGNFTVTPTVQVAIPANTYAGTYTSTVTLAVVSGP
jgi:hypothetical protein